MQALHHLMQMTAVESQIYKLKFELTHVNGGSSFQLSYSHKTKWKSFLMGTV